MMKITRMKVKGLSHPLSRQHKTLDDMLNILRWRASITTQKDFAREADVPEQYLSDVLMGRRLPSDRLLKVIGFRRKVIYVRLPETKANGTPRRGICRVCGCTRGCMWVDDSHTLCSRCADE